MLSLTNHARARIQQRGIPAAIVEDLLDFGREEYNHRGGCVVYFDRRARETIRQICGTQTYKRIEAHLDTYAVVGTSGSVITVGHRTRRIKRN